MKSPLRLVCATLTILAAIAANAAANAQTDVQYNLPEQSLEASLRTVGKSTDINILIDRNLVTGLKAPALKARLGVAEVIEHLLKGSGLAYEFVNSNTIVLTRAGAVSPIATQTNPSTSLHARGEGAGTADEAALRLAQNKSDATKNGENTKNDSPSSENSDSVKLEEIIVTAQKREQRQFDVPISIVAMGADELQDRKVATIDDLATAVPGLSVQSIGGWTRRIMLRGVGNVFGASSLIGMYLDEASATSTPTDQLDLRTYDLDRIEVLRGPQGTLYGEGSAGGTIRFITKSPQLDRFSLNTDVAALFTQDGAPGQRVEGALNLPLVKDVLGLRVVGTFDHQGGWIDQPAANQKDFNEQNVAHVRVKGLWKPVEQFSVNAMAVVHRNNAAPSTGEDSDGNYTQVFNLTTTPSVEDDYGLYNLTLTYDLPAVQVLSTSTYLKQDKEQRNFGYRLPIDQPPLPLYDVLKPLFTRNNEIATEELRLSSIGKGPWQWTVGGFYRYGRIDSNNTFYFAVPGAPGTPLPALIVSPGSTVSRSNAVFGDTSYQFAQRLTLGAGLRYFQDDQENRLNGQEASFDALNPRVYVQYKLTDEVNTYASAAKGFRSGGFNTGVGRPPYDPENVWTYEVGTKMELMQRRLRMDIAVFHSDYEDYQTSALVGALSITSNVGSAEIRGIEWGLDWRPVDSWMLGLTGDYVDSKFTKIDSTSASYAVGDPLDLFPKYGFTASSQNDFNWYGKPAFFRVDYNQQGIMTFRNRRSGPWYYGESDVINMLNFNTTVQWNESLSLSLFGQNLLNDRGYIDPFSIEQSAARARPRTFGIQFSAAF